MYGKISIHGEFNERVDTLLATQFKCKFNNFTVHNNNDEWIFVEQHLLNCQVGYSCMLLYITRDVLLSGDSITFFVVLQFMYLQFANGFLSVIKYDSLFAYQAIDTM